MCVYVVCETHYEGNRNYVHVYTCFVCFLQLALKYHPDKNQGNPEAEEMVSLSSFCELAAFSVYS